MSDKQQVSRNKEKNNALIRVVKQEA